MENKFILGTELMIFENNTTPLAFAKSCKLLILMNTLDVSSKDSGKWAEKLKGKLSFNLSSDNLFTVANYKDLVDKMITREPVKFQFSTASNQPTFDSVGSAWTPNTDGYKGEAYITSIEANAADGEVATYSVSFDGSGALTAVGA